MSTRLANIDRAVTPLAVSLGIRGIQNNRRNGNDQVVNLCYAALIFVGVGSAAYHMNLKYFTQMSKQSTASPRL